MARFKLMYTPSGLFSLGLKVNDAISDLSMKSSANAVSNAVNALKSSYYDITGGMIYNTLSKKTKPVDAEALKSSVTELSSRLGAMESIPAPNAADIYNDTVKKAVENVLKSDDFGRNVVDNNKSAIEMLVDFFDAEEVDKIFDIVSRLSKELLTESILNGADWDAPAQRKLSYEQWHERAFAEMAGNGIENKIPAAVQVLLNSTTALLARLAKQEAAKEIQRIHPYGEREVFIKNTCNRLFKNRSSNSKKIAEKSLFSKTDKRGQKSEAKTLGSMPVKEIKRHIEGCADFFGGYVPMIRFERFSERGKAGIANGEFVISVGSNTDKNTIWHEIAHHTERSLPWVSVLTKEYLVKKYKEANVGEKIARLRDLTGIPNYKPHEIAINNPSSPDFYVLKLYNKDIYVRNADHDHVIEQIRNVSSSEVFSMGAGYLADESLHEHSHDVDFVSTVLTIVERLQKEGKEWDTL